MKWASVLFILKKPKAHLLQFWLQYGAHWYWNWRAPWHRNAAGEWVRQYRTYDQYLAHQASKWWWYRRHLVKKWPDRSAMYQARFKTWAKPGLTILCLGARDGVEVAAFRAHQCLAIGIDLAYPKLTPYVVYGDMHGVARDWPAHSFDVVYTNCLDHAHAIGQVARQVRRLLKPEGFWWVDTYTHGQPGGAYEARDLPQAAGLQHALAACGWRVEAQQEFEPGMTSMRWRPC